LINKIDGRPRASGVEWSWSFVAWKLSYHITGVSWPGEVFRLDPHCHRKSGAWLTYRHEILQFTRRGSLKLYRKVGTSRPREKRTSARSCTTDISMFLALRCAVRVTKDFDAMGFFLDAHDTRSKEGVGRWYMYMYMYILRDVRRFGASPFSLSHHHTTPSHECTGDKAMKLR
jgi:hypothetical protein